MFSCKFTNNYENSKTARNNNNNKNAHTHTPAEFKAFRVDIERWLWHMKRAFIYSVFHSCAHQTISIAPKWMNIVNFLGCRSFFFSFFLVCLKRNGAMTRKKRPTWHHSHVNHRSILLHAWYNYYLFFEHFYIRWLSQPHSSVVTPEICADIRNVRRLLNHTSFSLITPIYRDDDCLLGFNVLIHI